MVIENKQFCYLLSSRVFVIQMSNISSTFQWNESLIIDRKEMLAVPFRMDFFRNEMKFILTGWVTPSRCCRWQGRHSTSTDERSNLPSWRRVDASYADWRSTMSQQLLTQFDENKEQKRNGRRLTARVLHNRMKTVEGKEKKLENSGNQVNRLFKFLSTSTVQI